MPTATVRSGLAINLSRGASIKTEVPAKQPIASQMCITDLVSPQSKERAITDFILQIDPSMRDMVQVNRQTGLSGDYQDFLNIKSALFFMNDALKENVRQEGDGSQSVRRHRTEATRLQILARSTTQLFDTLASVVAYSEFLQGEHIPYLDKEYREKGITPIPSWEEHFFHFTLARDIAKLDGLAVLTQAHLTSWRQGGKISSEYLFGLASSCV